MSNNVSQAGSAFCLVTGAAGFVGSHLVESLVNADNNVIAVDNLSSGTIKNLASVINHPNLYFYEKDIRQKDLLLELLNTHKNITSVFHLAAAVSVPYSIKHPEEARVINYDSALNLYHDAIKADIEKFIFAGSAAEYGDHGDILIDETAKTMPISPYGEDKLHVSEEINRNNKGTVLRFFNIYGTRQNPASLYCGVITRFVDSALSDKSITIYGDGKQTRDFIHISNAVQAYHIAAGFTGHDLNGIFNVGTGTVTTISDLANNIRCLTGNRCEIVRQKSQQGDIKYSCADISKIRKYGFKPVTSLTKGISELIDNVRNNEKIV